MRKSCQPTSDTQEHPRSAHVEEVKVSKDGVMSEDPWYSERRARWKPEEVRCLLIAESAPDDAGEVTNRRFFYDEDLTKHDGLFREVVKVIFGESPGQASPGAKTPWLRRLREEGVYVTDLASVPVNYYGALERHAALAENVAACVDLAVALKPDGVIVVKKNVFELLERPLRSAGLPLLHDEFVPFPGSGQQARFRERFAAAYIELPK